MKETLTPLVTRDRLRELDGLECPTYLHNDHRWALPILAGAQLDGSLPEPATLVMFDAHHDSWQPTKVVIEQCRRIRADRVSVPAVLDLCENFLRNDDADWVVAGMELGLIDDAVVFGLEDDFGSEKYQSHIDHLGGSHRLRFPELPHEALMFKGSLTDRAKPENAVLWEILNWVAVPGHGVRFGERERKIYLNFDLDAFVVRWEGFNFPWPEEVWTTRFQMPSDFDSTRGWTGRDFVSQLTRRAGLLTIAREPSFCGGEQNSDAIFDALNRHLFDSRLVIHGE